MTIPAVAGPPGPVDGVSQRPDSRAILWGMSAVRDEDLQLDTTRPFSRAAAIAAGITDKQLLGPRHRKLLHGVYVDAAIALTPILLAEAVLIGTPSRAWASHATAGRALGLPLPVLPGEHVSVLSTKDRRRRRGVRCHLRQDGWVSVVGGVRLSSYHQVFVELAEQLTLVDLVVVGDWMARNGKVGLADLRAFCAESRLPAARAARVAADHVRERVDSPMETRLRMLVVLAGLPEPEVNLTLRDEYGNPVRRHDLSYPGQKVAMEYDGRVHVERELTWERDRDRREAADEEGWRVLTILAKDIYKHPDRTLERIHRVLVARRVPGMPSLLSDDWRAHFPVRG